MLDLHLHESYTVRHNKTKNITVVCHHENAGWLYYVGKQMA